MTAQEISDYLMNEVDCDTLTLQEIDEDTNTFFVQDTDGNRFRVHVRKED
jgi:hypothetical protein